MIVGFYVILNNVIFYCLLKALKWITKWLYGIDKDWNLPRYQVDEMITHWTETALELSLVRLEGR